MPDDYAYPITQCYVSKEKRTALRSYRDKRRLWLSWIDTDEHHAIWRVLSSMMWTDVSFRALTHFAGNHENNGLNNALLAQALLDGHVATQVLAIRRLMDDGNSDIISLRRLVKDLRRNFALLTRENYVCFDGLPYDYEAVQQKEMMERAGKGFFWGETSGPSAHGTSSMAHEQFDKLSGIGPAKRSREDRLPASLLTTIERWLDDSGADELAKWSHAFLAHAGGPESRKRADLMVTTNKITDAIKALVRVTEAISAWLLFAGGRSNALMPVAQFNQFEKLDKPIMQVGGEAAADKVWQQLSDERNRYLDDVDAELIGLAKAQGPDFWQYKNDPELLSDPEGWCKREIEKILGRKIDLPPPSVQYSDRQHVVYWIDRATGEAGRFPPEGSKLSINEWHAMIFACSVVKSKTPEVWIADENGVRVADRKKIADFANTHGYR